VSRPRAVVFDLFHTLTGRESEWSDLPLTSTVLGVDQAAWNEMLFERSRWRLAGEERDPYTIIRTLAHALDPTIADSRIREATRIRLQRFRHSLLRIPSSNLLTLERLRGAGLRLGMISNADASEAAGWSDSPLCGRFDVALFSCDAGCVKPEPEIFRRCADALGVPPEESLFVGDGSSNELRGANEAGFTTVFISGIIRELWPEQIPSRLAIAARHIEAIPDILPLLGLPPLDAGADAV
jgi:putative hydrolase of the HAD superfamily